MMVKIIVDDELLVCTSGMEILRPLWRYLDISLEILIKPQKLRSFEVLSAVFMKNNIFWDTTPCSRLKVNRRF
jgi:hypothetical protein